MKQTKKNKLLSTRQEKILKHIIEEYADFAQPVASQLLNEKFFDDLSSATIRNDMSVLEKNGMIVKSYSSSGRTPTIKGYQYYNEHLNNNEVPEKFRIQINDLLSKRNLSIDEVISKSVEIISNSTNLLSVSKNIYEKDTLKKIDLVKIGNNQALFIIVTSSGNVIKRDMYIEDESNIDDVIVCVNVFNDRLIDSPLSKINDQIEILKELIKTKVKSYEFVIHEVVEKIFNNIDWTQIHISSSDQVLIHPEFNDINKLKQLIILLRDVSVWKQIGYNRQITGKTSISFADNIRGIEDVSIASTNITLRNSSHEIAVIGPNRLTNAKAKALLEFLKKELERNYK